MIGNNACGPRALGYGKTADNVVALEVVTGSGERICGWTAQRPRPTPPALHALQSLVQANLGTIRTEFGTLRPAGLRLQPGAPAAGERLRRAPGSWPAPRAPWR